MKIPIAPLLLIAATAAAGAAPQAAPELRLVGVEASRAEVHPNLLPNPGFEQAANGLPAGWAWDRRNTDATCTLDETVTHTGKRSLHFTNGTEFGAHVYGSLWRAAPAALQAGKTYTLSAYARSENPGIAWIGGGSGWQFRLRIPATGGKWQRVFLTFTPGDADAAFVPRICTESPNKGFWLDDVKLEEGGVPTSALGAADALTLETGEQERALEGDGAFTVDFGLNAPTPLNGVIAEAVLDRPRQVLRQPLTLAPGAYRVRFSGEMVAADDMPRSLSVRLLEGQRELASATVGLRCFSAANGLARVQDLRKRVATLRPEVDRIRQAGQDPAYPLVTLTVLENFLGYAEEDLRFRALAGWGWGVNGGAKAQMARDTQVTHSGGCAVHLSNEGPAGRDVYGSLVLSRPVSLRVGTPYTLSAWVRSTSPGTAWMGGGSQWRFRTAIPATGGQWRQVGLTFTPGEADREFQPRFNTDSATAGIWIDDVALVEGARADADRPNLLANGGFEQATGEVRRGLAQLADLEQMADRLEGELREAAAGKRRFASVPRWTGNVRPTIDGPSFIAPAALPGASPAPRPVFFVGYGHFNQVRADVEKFPRYGTNIIQVEFGPSRLFPREGETSDAPVRETLALLDRCRRAGVAVNLLISPHYLPEWMLAKYPEMRKHREGFLGYCLHHPAGQALLKRFIAAAIAPLKDHPALHSICLSNEPVNAEEPCEFATREWRAWLQKRHGDIATLNTRWGTKYAGFDTVPYPNPLAFAQIPLPVRLDYTRFNQEWFAGWHRMLADAVHAVAPNVPVHAKGMSWTFLNDGDVRFGADAELFGGFSQINGNDSSNNYTPEPGGFAQSWGLNAMAYDLQRSVKDAPVFNSENHLIPDRSTSYVPPEHIRAALWQGAVHGQSATTIWVWERTFDPASDFAGSIMHRPLCAEAVGTTCLDLNRLAPEVTAVQRLRPQVVILHSVSARVWDGGRASDCAAKLYTALSFTGLKLGWVTERQLEGNQLPEAAVLVVPNLVHLSDTAFAALKRYQGRIVLVGGDDVLSRGEYDTRREEKPAGERIPFTYGKTSWRDLWQALQAQLPGLGVRPAVQLRGADGKPAWGVSSLTAETPAGPVVNLCNYRSEPVQVTLERAGAPAHGTDLLSGQPAAETMTLKPLETRLLRLAR